MIWGVRKFSYFLHILHRISLGCEGMRSANILRKTRETEFGCKVQSGWENILRFKTMKRSTLCAVTGRKVQYHDWVEAVIVLERELHDTVFGSEVNYGWENSSCFNLEWRAFFTQFRLSKQIHITRENVNCLILKR